MVERVFLGWNRPFLHPAAGWLLERREELPGMWVLVPTAQSGRRLREALAEASGAVLAPRVATPGSLLKPEKAGVAPDWIERVAWAEILESVPDWRDYGALFPHPPGEGPGWAAGLAAEMAGVRRTLRENALTFAAAARILRGSVEEERWEALARLENAVESKLAGWGLRSHGRALAAGLELPAAGHIVLAGVTEMPPLLERALEAWNGRLSVLIAAPPEEAGGFSPLGRPLGSWSHRVLPWPEEPFGSVGIAADSRQQAAEAVRAAADGGRPSDRIALGSADAETGAELEQAFTREGWIAFHPPSSPAGTGLFRWFKVWSSWLADPTPAALADLLALPETGVLTGGRRAGKARSLSEARDRWMVMRIDELERHAATASFRREEEQTAVLELLEAARKLENWRGGQLGPDLPNNLRRLLEILARTSPSTREPAAAMSAWLAAAAPWMEKVKRSALFWIELMLSEVPPPAPQPPPGRMIDVQGWLELLYEPGEHLILCGMNEGKVPSGNSGDPWLGETIRAKLGLPCQADRAAADAFLYTSLLHARRAGGRVDVICGKTGAGGETLLPSRLLLAAERTALPGRVNHLFREIEPPEAGLRRETDWLWVPRLADPPQHLRVTAIGDYLRCPFRYYLKHVLRMQTPEPSRTEWNQRDFGTVAHEVLERWGRDGEARDYEKTEAIDAFLSNALDQVVAEWFGRRVPLAIRIQTESLRQRLSWLARVQAVQRASGWKVEDVERDVEIAAAGLRITAKIDRVDRHERDGRLRVIDYKTGKAGNVDLAHRSRITAASTVPSHLGEDGPAFFEGEEKGKAVRFRWTNLQLPLYAAALRESTGEVPLPCYFTLGATEADVALREWSGFSMDDLLAAEACAAWVAGRIQAGTFWPPAEKVTYDDYRHLAAGRPFSEAFEPPSRWRTKPAAAEAAP